MSMAAGGRGEEQRLRQIAAGRILYGAVIQGAAVRAEPIR